MENEELIKGEEVNIIDAEDGEESMGSLIFKAILLTVTIIALICLNPSKQDHQVEINKTISEVVQSKARSGYTIPYGQLKDVEQFKYHTVFVGSWTTARVNGNIKLLTIGALGWTCALF